MTLPSLAEQLAVAQRQPLETIQTSFRPGSVREKCVRYLIHIAPDGLGAGELSRRLGLARDAVTATLAELYRERKLRRHRPDNAPTQPFTYFAIVQETDNEPRP